MADVVESLILDLIEWVAVNERTYEEAMIAWRTSCPRLPVSEDANDRGLVEVALANGECIALSEGTYQELRERFDRLADGADPDLLDDLREMPFGSYGHLADRFGIHWFFKGQKR